MRPRQKGIDMAVKTERRTTAAVLAVLAVLAVAAGADAQDDPAGEARDRETLVDFYHAYDGPNWRNKEWWLSDLPLRSWRGVSTGSRFYTGPVTALRLERPRDPTLVGQHLKGPFTGEIVSRLTDIHTLWLGANLSHGGSQPPPKASLRRLAKITWRLLEIGAILESREKCSHTGDTGEVRRAGCIAQREDTTALGCGGGTGWRSVPSWTPTITRRASR